jgi:uncharacterized membrane protein YccC
MANWGASKKRALMRRRGTERAIDDSASMVRRAFAERSTNDRPPPKSKEELRADAARAFLQWRAAKEREASQCP